MNHNIGDEPHQVQPEGKGADFKTEDILVESVKDSDLLLSSITKPTPVDPQSTNEFKVETVKTEIAAEPFSSSVENNVNSLADFLKAESHGLNDPSVVITDNLLKEEHFDSKRDIKDGTSGESESSVGNVDIVQDDHLFQPMEPSVPNSGEVEMNSEKFQDEDFKEFLSQPSNISDNVEQVESLEDEEDEVVPEPQIAICPAKPPSPQIEICPAKPPSPQIEICPAKPPSPQIEICPAKPSSPQIEICPAKPSSPQIEICPAKPPSPIPISENTLNDTDFSVDQKDIDKPLLAEEVCSKPKIETSKLPTQTIHSEEPKESTEVADKSLFSAGDSGDLTIGPQDFFSKFGLDAWFHPERLHPKVEALVYWRDPVKSGVVFGVSLSVLIALSVSSLISVVANLSLLVLALTIVFRIYKSIQQAVQKTTDGHPFKEYLEHDFTLPQEKVRELTDTAVAHFNAGISKLRKLFLVEDLIDSIKFGVGLWALRYIGAWFNGLTLIILGLIALFTLPKVYENNKTQIDQNWGIAKAKIAELTSKLRAAVPVGKKADSKDKDQ